MTKPSTLPLEILFFCTMAVFHFIFGWTPRLSNAAGVSSALVVATAILLIDPRAPLIGAPPPRRA
ncbi:MAG TPA: hypothetical protein VN692_07600, partial [Steroidobacteraceae bacterium]|nr:hypothetical protein [Steroidobacteraceae bacterium]